MRVTNLHVYPSHFTHETRMLKETKSIAECLGIERVRILAIWADGLAESEQLDEKRNVWRVKLSTRTLGRSTPARIFQFIEWLIRGFWHFRKENVAIVSCHCLAVLPFGLALKVFSGSRIVYEAHELETERNGWRGARRWFAKCAERALFPFVDHTVVVGPSIKRWYEREYKTNKVGVVRNIPYKIATDKPKTTLLKDRLNVPKESLLFLYQGILNQGRGIELILAAFSRSVLSDKHVVFLGFGPLEAEIKKFTRKFSNIHFHDAVKPQELSVLTESADVGLALFENTSLSYFYSCPNKMFECILGGVPPIVSDFPDMREVVEQYQCGWTTAVDEQSLAGLCERITRDEVNAKRDAALHARAFLSWEQEAQTLTAEYLRLLNGVS